MLGIGRRRTHRELVKSELNESMEHFLRAANHAAGGVNATMAPRVEAARDRLSPTAGRVRDAASAGWESTVSTLAPLASVVRREPPPPRRRGYKLVGLLLVGAAVGAAGALVMRRRRQQQWAEYDPAHSLDDRADRAESTVDTVDPVPTTAPAEDLLDRAARSGNGRA